MQTRQLTLDELLALHQDVFNNKKLGTVKDFKARVTLKDGAQPIFCKARPVPYALRGKVEEELDRLEKDGVIKKVSRSDWASQLVCVPKKDGGIRVRGDFKVSVNRVLQDNPYPLPDIADMFATMEEGTMFTKIDVSNAYQQMLLEEESKQYLTVNTHKGFYAYQRLTYSIATAPAICNQ